MKHVLPHYLSLAGLVGLTACASELDTQPTERTSTEDGRYIVGFVDRAAGRSALRAAGAEEVLAIRGMNAAAFRIPRRAVAALEQSPNIAFIEEDLRRYPLAESVPYGIEMVQADRVSDDSAANRTVCVIDSGYYIGHADLQDSGVTASEDSRSGNPFIDSCGHGTHVTGTIAALANGEGVVGVLPSGNLGLHIVKVFGDDDFESGSCGFSYSSSVLDAAFACADAGADVINMSLGGGGSSDAEAQGYQDLFDQGVLLVAAAGNDGNTQLSFPASYDAVISVAAVDQDKELAEFSQRNAQVELAAPGVSVLSTTPTEEAALTVDGEAYFVGFMDKSVRTVATGALADGGLCDGQDASWNGRVVLCERGEISFGDKVANVAASGGVAAVIYNNEPGGFTGTLQQGGSPNFESQIPAVSASQEDGQALLAGSLGGQAEVSTELLAPADGYAAQQGTSMASPHVAGVAALVWSHDTSWTNRQIRDALAATAEDLGAAGRDNSFGHGLVQAQAALDHLTGGGCSLAISDVEATSVDPDDGSFAITWKTDEPMTSKVTFTCCGAFADGERKTDHRMVFRGSPGASYEYAVSGTTSLGCAEEGPFGHEN